MTYNRINLVRPGRPIIAIVLVILPPCTKIIKEVVTYNDKQQADARIDKPVYFQLLMCYCWRKIWVFAVVVYSCSAWDCYRIVIAFCDGCKRAGVFFPFVVVANVYIVFYLLMLAGIVRPCLWARHGLCSGSYFTLPPPNF